MSDKNVPSDENKEVKELKVVEPEKKVEQKKNKKVKEPISIKKLLTIIVISLLALLMVGGSFYYIFLPDGADKSAFGTFDGKPVLFEYNNVFYRSYTQLAEENAEALNSGDYSTMMSVWQQAYQNQVMFMGVSELAKEAKISAPEELVNKEILETGIYNNADGVFDETVFNGTNPTDRRYTYDYMEANYPYQTVLGDLSTSIVSQKEADFVSAMGDKTRVFQYFYVDYTVYPDDLARQYGEADPSQFKTMKLSVLTSSTLEESQEVYETLKGGADWTTTATEKSIDSYAPDGGSLGQAVNPWAITGNMKNATDLDKILALEAGSFTEPIEGAGSYWTIYKLEEPIADADFTDPETLANVKYYIFTNEKESMQPYLDEALVNATEAAQADFATASVAYGRGIAEVSATPNNVGESQFFGGFSYTDANGLLATAASGNQELARELYTNPTGYVTGPIAVGDGNIFVQIKDDQAASSMGSLINTMYGYYAQQLPLNDQAYAVLTSDKFVDNFYAQFFNLVLGTSLEGVAEN